MSAMRSFVLSSLLALPVLTSTAHAEESAPPETDAPEAAPADTAPDAAPPAEGAPAETPATAAPEAAPEAPKPKPPPYSLPWQLRPVGAATVIRSDTSFAFYENAAGKGGNTIATTLLGSYKVTPEFAPLVRFAFVDNSPPAPGKSGTGFANPAIGGLYSIKTSPETRLGLFLGVALPFGSGGGNNPNPATRAAVLSGINARAAMDNAMFAMNYLTVFPGVGFAYVAHGLTVQVEATLLQLTRVKGDQVDKESSKTNFTTGLHVGYFFIPQLSVGAELRHQRWLSTPNAVKASAAARDTTTFAVGPRFHFKLSDTAWFRPGIAYSRGVDEPLTKAKYNIVQLDLPFSF